MRESERVISLLGSAGGVARAMLSLLNKTLTDPNDPLYPFIHDSKLHFIDLHQKSVEYYQQYCPNLIRLMTLHQFDLRDLDKVRNHLSYTRTKIVIDLSWADTVDMLGICNELGVSYVNSALENVEVDEDEDLEGYTLLERYKRFEAARHRFTDMKGIVCSGMNPGVVQWMALHLMNANSDEKPLACYIVETDSTFFMDKSLVQKNTVYSSWSPECYLDEAILNYPMLVKQGVPLHLYTPVYEQEFKVTLGDIQFYGCLMPHEEVLTLGKLFDFEAGFIYKVNDYTTQMIRDHFDDPDRLWDMDYQIFDPAEAALEGEDLVGVLLVYEDKERFMFNVMDSRSTFQEFGTNATYLQVACGVYAGVCTLLLEDLPKGVFYVDELLESVPNTGYGKYVGQYMKKFVIGENAVSEGLLLDRMRKI